MQTCSCSVEPLHCASAPASHTAGPISLKLCSGFSPFPLLSKESVWFCALAVEPSAVKPPITDVLAGFRGVLPGTAHRKCDHNFFLFFNHLSYFPLQDAQGFVVIIM